MINELSIRAQYAYELTILESCLTDEQINTPICKEIFNQLWELISVDDDYEILGDWLNRANEITPCNIFEFGSIYENNTDIVYLGKDKFEELKAFYLILPQLIKDGIDDLFEPLWAYYLDTQPPSYWRFYHNSYAVEQLIKTQKIDLPNLKLFQKWSSGGVCYQPFLGMKFMKQDIQ